MIPLKLHIKNFISYGSNTQTIDFSPYNLICLSGKNGHGKSALLDALTWAIWGQARKISGISKADDGLLRLGQSHMMVSVDFSCNDIVYRVRREYTNSPKMQTTLDFGIVETETQQFKALTDKTIKITQEKIENSIGIDYESFINSAFLRQGQSNEFSKKTPKDRKEILANILGLNKFEQLKKRAYEKARQANIEKDYLSKLNGAIKIELEKKDSVTIELQNICSNLENLAQKEKTIESKFQDIKLQEQSVADALAKVNQLKFQKDQLQKNILEHSQDFLLRVKNFRSVIAQEHKISSYSCAEAQRIQIQEQLSKIKTACNLFLDLKEKILASKELLVSKQTAVDLHFNTKRDQINSQIEQNAIYIKTTDEKFKELLDQQIKLTNEIFAVEQEIIKLNLSSDNNFNETLSKSEIIFEKRKNFYQKFITQINSLKLQLTDVQANRKKIDETKNPECPLCLQDLSQESKIKLLTKFNCNESKILHVSNRLTNIVKNLKAILIEQHESIAVLKKDIENLAIAKIKKEELLKTISRLKITNTEMQQLIEKNQESSTVLKEKEKSLIQERAALEDNYFKTIENDPELIKLKKEILDFEAQISELNYDPKQEIELNKKLEEITKEIQLHSDLLKEKALYDERKASIANLNKIIKNLKNNLLNIDQELLSFESIFDQEKALKLFQQNLNFELKNILSEREKLLQSKGALEQHIAILFQKNQEYDTHISSLKNLENSYNDYSLISTALGKDGIQALLIEDAIPEIEQEANNLLAKLTDNQAQLFIESLRDLRAGGTKETLDIKISDACGIRAYELFSGGEAFRIDFALRIAISKLLARRSGTSLQTLIIDEGFGSQDEEGLANIMDALLKIQDDFSKIIIVSHLPSMKEQFPVHFHIHKGAQGSSIKVIENA